VKAGAIIVAAGSGKRMGKPKQFLPLRGRPVVEWALLAFLSVPDVEEIVVVLSPENLSEHGGKLKSERVRVVEGGETRMDSLRKGLAALSPEVDVVAVHDGARPLVTSEVIRACLDEAEESGAAVPAVPVKDTLKKVASKGLWVSDTPARSSFWLAQTPQTFKKIIIEKAYAKLRTKNITDDAQAAELAGYKVAVVPGEYSNIKITDRTDFDIAKTLMSFLRKQESMRHKH